VLNNRKTALWREQARKDLKDKLLERKNEAYRWIEQGDAEAEVEMKLLKPAMRELDLLIVDLFHESPEEVKDMPHRAGSLGDLVAIKITARLFKKVCERLAI
jgi:hypothetical protein